MVAEDKEVGGQRGEGERESDREEAGPERRYGPLGGITLGGIIVIVGVILLVVSSFWIGFIIALVGLVFFGGFVRGKWY